MKEYMNRETGEVLTEEAARLQWQEEYDGGDPTNPEKFTDRYAELVYVYGMRLRGFSIGCQPKEGFVERRDDRSGKYYDLIYYNRPLTEKEVADYELDYICATSKQAL